MALASLAPRLAWGLVLAILALTPIGAQASAEPPLQPCDASQLAPTSAEVSETAGLLAGTVYINGYRAMPPCSVQGTPHVQVLDASGNTLAVAQVPARDSAESPSPVTLSSAARPAL